MAADWQQLTRLTSGRAVVVERVRLEVPVEVFRQADKNHAGTGDRTLNISYDVEVNDREMSFP